MAKTKSAYICQTCTYQSARWLGQCPECGGWNTLVETVINSAKTKQSTVNDANKPVYLSKLSTERIDRVSSNIGEFDRVIGGGFVPGQVILLAGEPGIGKSTILTQIARNMSCNVLYICGEESPGQVKVRADRLGYGGENLLLMAETNVENIIASLNNYKDEVGLVIVDSVQTLNSSDLMGMAGSIGQVRASSQALTEASKKLSLPLILVGHVTKDGNISGPKILEHIVDTVLYLEGDAQHMYRLLKTTKNRFGAVSEVGVFEMSELGMVEVKNPSKLFLSESKSMVSGTCTTVLMEGYRPLLFEIQALTTKTAFGYPRRTTSGFNANRLQVLIAILEKRCQISLSEQDVYLSVAGGFKVTEYASDLAVALAIVSSVKNIPLKPNAVAFGELGLSGEIRRVSHQESRVKEAKKLGFTDIISHANYKDVMSAVTDSFGRGRK